MTKEEAIDIVKCLAWHDLRPSEEDIEQAIRALEQEPCEMTADDYRQRMIQAFHNADCEELIALVVLPTEKEFEHLGWLLEKHYKAKPEPCTDAISRQAVNTLVDELARAISDERCCVSRGRSTATIMQDILDLPPVTSAEKQEPYNDCVSRQYLVEKAVSWDKHFADGIRYVALTDILNAPSVTPAGKVGQWTPVSERLPDIHNYCMKYLVTDCHRHIHTSLFIESGGNSWWSREDIIAWMPLPKPYKTESEDGE